MSCFLEADLSIQISALRSGCFRFAYDSPRTSLFVSISRTSSQVKAGKRDPEAFGVRRISLVLKVVFGSSFNMRGGDAPLSANTLNQHESAVHLKYLGHANEFALDVCETTCMNARVLAGMATGAVVMFLFGLLWMVIGLARGRSLRKSAKVALLLIGIALAIWIGMNMAHYTGLSHSAPPSTATEMFEARRTGRIFSWISGLEGAAIFLAVLVLKITRRPQAILPAIAIIVGVHFLPLAALFAAPVYYATGVLGCAIGITGFFVADTKLRSTVVGLSFGTLLWATSVFVLLQMSTATV